MKKIILHLLFTALLINPLHADTFKNSKTNQTLTGFIQSQPTDPNTPPSHVIAITPEKGRQILDLNLWSVTPDRNGRNNLVIIITHEGPIQYKLETQALIDALNESVSRGPLFILLELDTPGGSVELAQQICNAISQIQYCPVYAYIKDGQHGGAISAGVALAFACDKIFMKQGTSLGGATMIAVTESGVKTMKEAYGQEIGEKFTSIWRSYLASMATKNNRSPLLAQAMVDSQIHAVEVKRNDTTMIIDPADQLPTDTFIKTWSKKGQLLTLPAPQAVQAGLADMLVESRHHLLESLQAADAKIYQPDNISQASEKLRYAKNRMDKIVNKIDFDIKQLQGSRIPRPKGLRLLRQLRTHFKYLGVLSEQYPDLKLDTKAIEAQINSIEAYYQQVK